MSANIVRDDEPERRHRRINGVRIRIREGRHAGFVLAVDLVAEVGIELDGGIGLGRQEQTLSCLRLAFIDGKPGLNEVPQSARVVRRRGLAPISFGHEIGSHPNLPEVAARPARLLRLVRQKRSHADEQHQRRRGHHRLHRQRPRRPSCSRTLRRQSGPERLQRALVSRSSRGRDVVEELTHLEIESGEIRPRRRRHSSQVRRCSRASGRGRPGFRPRGQVAGRRSFRRPRVFRRFVPFRHDPHLYPNSVKPGDEPRASPRGQRRGGPGPRGLAKPRPRAWGVTLRKCPAPPASRAGA